MTPKRTPAETLARYDACLYVSEQELASALKRSQAQVALLCSEMADIREYLTDVPCHGACDSYGICKRCCAREATWMKELIEQDRLPKEKPPNVTLGGYSLILFGEERFFFDRIMGEPKDARILAKKLIEWATWAEERK